MKLIKYLFIIIIGVIVVTPAMFLLYVNDGSILLEIASAINYLFNLILLIIFVGWFDPWFDSKIKEDEQK